MRTDRNPDITEHMGTFIKSRRKALGLSLDQLANRIDCSKAHIWKLEKSQAKNPTLWMILGLCDGLQCSLNDLLGRDVSQPQFTAEEIALIDCHRRIFGD